VHLVPDDLPRVYATTAHARAEFPEYAPLTRVAISLGRAAQDPLAEMAYLWVDRSDGGAGAATARGADSLTSEPVARQSERARIQKEKLETARRERAAKFTGCNLYVRNLDETVDDDRLRKEFEPFGAIQSARVAKDTDGHTRGFGFVCFKEHAHAQAAVRGLTIHALAVEMQLPVFDGQEPGGRLEQGCFAGAVGAYQRQALAGRERQRHAAQRLDTAVGDVKVADAQQGRDHARSP
jgi:hypothetical protein